MFCLEAASFQNQPSRCGAAFDTYTKPAVALLLTIAGMCAAGCGQHGVTAGAKLSLP